MNGINETTRKNLIDKFKYEMKKVDGTDNIIDFLEKSGFFEYPAGLKHHGAFKGGLLSHSISLYLEFSIKCDSMKIKIKDRTRIISSLLHDVCKLYEYNKNKASGRYEWNKNRFDNTHGTKSIKIIEQFFELNPTEKALIKYHMGIYKTEIYVKFGHPEYTLKEYDRIVNKHPIVLLFHNCDNEVSKFIC